ncbi:hypothetical protein KDH_02100 [Dictyobacter sp. S3.2.2.5]|uniref:Putative collagen-binding domain-containing protein n=1 Tax=Dictyobacter halimunensis TaxID=3026934 RepID=A0ABQ6FLT3_9CHLR|nr:hypothetical protein KDH_02100 [Dictyobacter sp. S3.2.2.5]
MSTSQPGHLHVSENQRFIVTERNEPFFWLGDTAWELFHMQATRNADRSYAFVYIPTAGQTFTLDLSSLAGESVQAWWYDPREGSATPCGTFARVVQQTFTTPSEGPDWVLVLDNTAQGFRQPGSRKERATAD